VATITVAAATRKEEKIEGIGKRPEERGGALRT
jgi:hypothetical protein